VLEGVVVGAAQEFVLRQRLTRLRRWSWILATAIGAGLAWMLGMVPSTVMALSSSESTSPSSGEPTAVVTALLAAGLGLAAGPDRSRDWRSVPRRRREGVGTVRRP
jgi:hypothetical protein